MPKAKPVSLHPLSFDEAITAFMRVNPGRPAAKRAKPKRRGKRKHQGNRK